MTEQELKEPKDLGVKIASKEGAFWINLKQKCEDMIVQCEHEIELQKHCLKLVNKKITEEEQQLATSDK